MSADAAFRLSGLLPIREAAPCFATPLFVPDGSNRECIQSIDREMNLLGFIEPTLPTRPRAIRDLPSRTVEFAGRPYFAFMPRAPEIVFGPADEIGDRLRSEGLRLADFPFVQRSVARFLADDELEAEAEANIRRKLDRAAAPMADAPALDVRTVPTVAVSMTAYRLTQAARQVSALELTTPEDRDALAALEQLTSGPQRDAPPPPNFAAPADQHRQLSQILTGAFRYGGHAGSRFAPPARGAFYAAETLDGAAADVAWHHARMAEALGASPALSRRFVVSAWTIEGELADFARMALDPNDFAQTQAAGERLRRARFSGVLFDSPYRRSERSVCLFDPAIINAGRLAGVLTLQVGADGSYSYDVSA